MNIAETVIAVNAKIALPVINLSVITGRMEMTMTAAEIHEARQRLGLSQGKLAKRLGVTVGAVSRWERGEMKPQPYLRLALAALADDKKGQDDANDQG
jgi:DNA-binding transcriptional regulator YiaG